MKMLDEREAEKRAAEARRAARRADAEKNKEYEDYNRRFDEKLEGQKQWLQAHKK
jgi:hypothetical protein